MRRGAELLGLVAITAVATGCGGGSKTAGPKCPVRTGPGAYLTSIAPAAGPPGTRVTVSGRLPVVDESGRDIGQTATKVDAYWNLDPGKWWTALTRSPLAAVSGSRVRHLGHQDVAKLCGYRVRIEIPPVRRGIYPIEVLYGDSKGRAGFGPVHFQVVGG